jgi:predicted lipoprotein with Yx(FWY)xxD motif
MKKIVIFAVVAFMAVACGKNSNNTSSPAPSASEANAKPTPAAAGSSATVKTVSSSKGTILADAATGKTLYEFDNDTAGKSDCESACATTWPPLRFTGTGSPTGITELTTITRTDGSKQVAYNGHPLYTYSGDTAAGQTNGDGLFGKWHVVKVSS